MNRHPFRSINLLIALSLLAIPVAAQSVQGQLNALNGLNNALLELYPQTQGTEYGIGPA